MASRKTARIYQNDTNGNRRVGNIEYGKKYGVDEIGNMAGESQPIN